MNDELEIMWNETVMVQIEVLPRNLSGGTEGNHVERRSGESVSRPSFGPGISRVQVESFTLASSLGRSG
jgi:hypothetical protein